MNDLFIQNLPECNVGKPVFITILSPDKQITYVKDTLVDVNKSINIKTIDPKVCVVFMIISERSYNGLPENITCWQGYIPCCIKNELIINTCKNSDIVCKVMIDNHELPNLLYATKDSNEITNVMSSLNILIIACTIVIIIIALCYWYLYK